MATSKEYHDFILEQLSLLDHITSRSMMGEYLLYYQGVLFGGIYDHRLMVKITDTNEKYHLPQEIPYETAKKSMYRIDEVDNPDLEFVL
ncbi:TfoX/Sxy family protein [bacterium]|nr:TfoX/Sxy family protein [bacterium]